MINNWTDYRVVDGTLVDGYDFREERSGDTWNFIYTPVPVNDSSDISGTKNLDDNSNTNYNSSSNTGDNSNVPLTVFIIFISSMGVCVLHKSKKN